MTDQQLVFDQLRLEGTSGWKTYLEKCSRSDQAPPLSLLIAHQHTAGIAKATEDLAWAEIAIECAELEALRSSGLGREEATLSAMRLRAWFIAKMGPRPGHRVLAFDDILEWALAGVDIPLEAVEELSFSVADRLTGRTILLSYAGRASLLADLRLLRRLRHRLKVIQTLADAGQLPSESLLTAWLEVCPRLP